MWRVTSEHRFRPSHSNAARGRCDRGAGELALAWGLDVLGEVLELAKIRLRPRLRLARALSDSNIDWGQALGELKRYMDREQIPALYLSYFGSARPSDDYGIRYQYLPSFSGEESDYLLPPSGKQIVAISVTNLQGVYLGDSDLYAWLPTSALFAVAGTPGPPGRRGIQGETGDALT